MRWAIYILVVLVLAPVPGAYAGDFDVLRGSEVVGPAAFTRWTGFYAGGQFSYSSASGSFAQATEPLVSKSLAELELETVAEPSTWNVIGSSSNRTSGFGGFAGYNAQWQDLILGIEGNYTHSPVTIIGNSTPILNRVFAVGSNDDSVNLIGTGTLSISDYGSVRARAGLAFNNFLPYGFAGVALGWGSYNVTSLIYGQQNAPQTVTATLPCNPQTVTTCVDYSFSNSASQSGVLLYGFSVGGGFDWALLPNIFVRGEYEYVQFAPVAGISASISSLRVGAGVKF